MYGDSADLGADPTTTGNAGRRFRPNANTSSGSANSGTSSDGTATGSIPAHPGSGTDPSGVGEGNAASNGSSGTRPTGSGNSNAPANPDSGTNPDGAVNPNTPTDPGSGPNLAAVGNPDSLANAGSGADPSGGAGDGSALTGASSGGDAGGDSRTDGSGNGSPAVGTGTGTGGGHSAGGVGGDGVAGGAAAGGSSIAHADSGSGVVGLQLAVNEFRTVPAATAQLVVVHAPNARSSFATLETFGRGGGGSWVPALGAMAARIGGNGFSGNKREGDRTTPVGMFTIDPTIYGIAADPGVSFAYHRLVAGDYWNENSSSPGYNTFVHGSDPGGPSEALWTVAPQYTYFAVVQYDTPAAPGAGSGIFLHENGVGATAGCVSLSHDDLVRVLTWLQPGAQPRIVLAPDGSLANY